MRTLNKELFMSLATTELHAFAQSFDTAYEDKAISARGQFLRSYPLSQLDRKSVV